jgi:hypothetical protein
MIHLSEVDMMKTKTIKTPLMMAEAYSLSACPSSLALESKLSRKLESHTGLVPRLSHHEWKNLKNSLFRMNVLYIENVFYCFSSDDVFSCEATSDDVRACAGACSQAQSHAISTKAQRAKTSAEGFSWFLFITET